MFQDGVLIGHPMCRSYLGIFDGWVIFKKTPKNKKKSHVVHLNYEFP